MNGEKPGTGANGSTCLALSGTELAEGSPIDLLLESAVALHIRDLELWFPQNTKHAGTDGTLRKIADSGLRIACVATGSELYRNGGSTQDQRLLLQAIALAERSGARIVNTYFGYNATRDDEYAINTYAGYLAPCLDKAEKAGITITLENEFNSFGHDRVRSDITRRPHALRQLFEKISSPFFALNFDPCNFYCAGIDAVEAYEILHPHIAYCHVKDGKALNGADVSPGVNEWRLFSDYGNRYIMAPLGDGAVPWKRLIKSFRQNKYAGFLTLEPHCELFFLGKAWTQSAAFLRDLCAAG
jgi:sugar phosphate isomerase/epimerase